MPDDALDMSAILDDSGHALHASEETLDLIGAQPEEEWSARVVKHVLCKRFVLPTKSPAKVNKKNEGG